MQVVKRETVLKVVGRAPEVRIAFDGGEASAQPPGGPLARGVLHGGTRRRQVG